MFNAAARRARTIYIEEQVHAQTGSLRFSRQRRANAQRRLESAGYGPAELARLTREADAQVASR